MIRPNYYIICHYPNGKSGYLFLMSKGRKNRKRKALGIAIKKSHFENFWNETDQKFRSGMENYKILNEKIADAIEEHTKETGEIKEVNKSVKQSFLSYWDRQIQLIPNQGTKGKHIVVKKKLEKYLQTIKKNDLSFIDLTPDFIKDVHYNFKTDAALTTNSVNSYMKLINNIVRRKIKDDPYTFPVSPFATIKYDRKVQPVRKVLDDKELKNLLATKIEDTKLDLVRDMYVFQIFAQGMRISDLCLLRWNNIVLDVDDPFDDKEVFEPQLDYVMFKTREPANAPFTFYICKVLLKVMGLNDLYDFFTDPSALFVDYNDKRTRFTDLEPEIKKHTFETLSADKVDFKGYIIKKTDNQYIKGLIDAVIEAKQQFISEMVSITALNLKLQREGKSDTDFVFPILNSKDFQNISDKDLDFKDVVSKSEELHHKLEYGKKIYRRQLDKVGGLCSIKDIMPHSARHTFTLLMLKAGASTHNIMQELGHTTLNVTDSYVRHKKFKNKYGNNFLEMIGNKIDYLDND